MGTHVWRVGKGPGAGVSGSGLTWGTARLALPVTPSAFLSTRPAVPAVAKHGLHQEGEHLTECGVH